MNVQLELPAESSDLEFAVAQIDANRISGIDVDIIRRIHSIDDTPEAFLPILAWEYSVDEWDPVWPIDTQKAVIKVSYQVHKVKGTSGAVRKAIEALQLGARIQEWFEYGGGAYRFRLFVDLQPEQPWTPDNQNLLIRTVMKTKNVRSFLEEVRLKRTALSEGPYIAGIIRVRQSVRVAPYVPREVEARPYVYVAATARAKQTIRLHPEF
ncbi:phage tail protein I [Roseibium sp.]|uniref:phage tail protein I n=1 Tax=Roseibium sp. TaxID=1936156 RepID=UPI003B51D428